MPALSQSAAGQHTEVVNGIYIARGNDTLGPYNSLEAAALVTGGFLRLDDYAARNGDPNWCALADFLPLSTVGRSTEPTPVVPVAPHPHRWRRLAVAFAVLLAVPLLVAGGLHWFRQPRAVVSAKPPVPSPAAVAASPVPAVVAPPAFHETAPPPADGTVTGSLSFTLPQAGQVSFAGVRVSAYPLAALELGLGQKIVEADAARIRLDPQVEAAIQDRTLRATEAESALKTLREADPADPMIESLRFASRGARTAAKTAEDDCRYLLDERAAAAGGEVYFQGLPTSAITMDTDAQGRFTLLLPPGAEPYAVAASVRQTADDGTVYSRYWLLRLSPAQRAGHEPVTLDDGNASSSPAVESLIHTAD